jgi:hypothetical protein
LAVARTSKSIGLLWSILGFLGKLPVHTSEPVHPALGGLPTDAAAAAAAHPTLGGLAAESTLLAALRRLGLLSAALDRIGAIRRGVLVRR